MNSLKKLNINQNKGDKMKKIKLSPSILDSDLASIKETVKLLEKNRVDFIHFDVMDGNFVPNLTFGPNFIKSIRKLTSLPFDVHLMIKNPENYVENFKKAGADYITIHYEATKMVTDILKNIKNMGGKSGISVKPKTKITAINKYLKYLDLILIMSVEPGFGGQKFMPEVLEKVKYLKKIRDEKKLNFLISIDGGINPETAKYACKAGVDILVAGSAIFKSNSPSKIIKQLYNSCKNI